MWQDEHHFLTAARALYEKPIYSIQIELSREVLEASLVDLLWSLWLGKSPSGQQGEDTQ